MLNNQKRIEAEVLLREIYIAVSDLKTVMEHLGCLGTEAETADCCDDTIDLLLDIAEMLHKKIGQKKVNLNE